MTRIVTAMGRLLFKLFFLSVCVIIFIRHSERGGYDEARHLCIIVTLLLPVH